MCSLATEQLGRRRPAGRRPTGNGEAIVRAVEELEPDIVLVDYFDTLVTRRVHRHRIRHIAARHLRDHFGLPVSAEELVVSRRQAEEDVAARWGDAGLDPQYRLDEVADQMWCRLDGVADDRPARKRFVAAVERIELGVEVLAQQVDTDVVDALIGVADSRPLVLVSDFHLPEIPFRRMLESKGLADLFGRVFVSCDPRLTKRSGRLYPFVLDQLEGPGGGAVDPERVLMIGDHPISDQQQARRAGLAACPIVRDAPTPTMRARIARRVVPESWRRHGLLRSIASEAEQDFAEMAFTLYAFVRLLRRQAVRDGVDHLAFLAREGQYLERLFERYGELAPDAQVDDIGCSYLVVSRRSTNIAGLRPLGEEDFAALLAQYPDVSLAGFVGSLGGEGELIDELASALGVDRDAPVPLLALEGHDGFRRWYEATRLTQNRLLRDYVDQTVGRPGADLHVVDVGWKGTIQDHLQRALAGEREVWGYYLGIAARREDPAADRKHAVLFDRRGAETAAFRQLRHFKSLYEYLLQADHGSAARYRRGDGVVDVELDSQPEESRQFLDAVAPIQEGLLSIFDRICRLDGLAEHPLLDDLSTVARFHSRMLFFPRRSELDRVLSLRFYGNYGRMAYSSPIILGLTPRQRARALVETVRNPRRLVGQGWAPLELARLGLRPLIPVLGAARLVRERLVSPIAARR